MKLSLSCFKDIYKSGVGHRHRFHTKCTSVTLPYLLALWSLSWPKEVVIIFATTIMDMGMDVVSAIDHHPAVAAVPVLPRPHLLRSVSSSANADPSHPSPKLSASRITNHRLKSESANQSPSPSKSTVLETVSSQR